MPIEEQERLRRWRLILGRQAAAALGLGAGESSERQSSFGGDDERIDRALEMLYDAERTGGLGPSNPYIPRWLGDIRTYFPTPAVRILQQDALKKLNLKQLLLEPELLASVEADLQLVTTLLSLKSALPERTRETARSVVRKLVEELERKLAYRLEQAVRGSLLHISRTMRPRPLDIDWDRTIRLNLKHYQREQRTIIPERLIGHRRRQRQAALRDIVLCVDQSGSMAPSVVYASIFGAVLASLRAISTRMIVFDTAVVDLSEHLQDPVDLLFGAQLGGGTDINRALAYCQQLITRPRETVLVLITDLYEGGDAEQMLRRAAALVDSGVQFVCLLALSDQGTPAFHTALAGRLAALGIPTFSCTPELFPELMAAALQRRDLNMWAAQHDIVAARPIQF
ncbi:VWA domain-containing protein [Thermogemmatispora aurantia]|uniref:VWA domain-containing protein n=1 Tax=Thermogemmatispora aurantia TaxID=2045279 RepID=UPI00124BD5DE|nr:VWA domain-containing protein [Thermogemmatispora aurantia]GER85455.1 VWA domain-containing protein [Thermogemmatispora aurantia]